MHRFKKTVKKLRNLVFGDKNYTPFILLSTARTGSNLLRSYLNNHPEILVDDEILKKLNNRDHRKILESCWGPQPKNLKAVGFKLFYGHPYDEKDKHSWKTILEKPDLHIIHLKRDNAVRSFISERIAFYNDEWLSNDQAEKSAKEAIYYNPEKLLRKLNQLDDEMAWAENFFSGIPKIEVEYNELTQKRDQTMNRITEFLNIQDVPVTTPLRRQNPESMSKLVTNWDEITSVLKGTKWEKYLND
ncbi:MAG TPA: hypothetical protein DCE78_09185 [Bacteroidetes bacterium]|nr:hypothetical protein [Bacteroidota bacterium]